MAAESAAIRHAWQRQSKLLLDEHDSGRADRYTRCAGQRQSRPLFRTHDSGRASRYSTRVSKTHPQKLSESNSGSLCRYDVHGICECAAGLCVCVCVCVCWMAVLVLMYAADACQVACSGCVKTIGTKSSSPTIEIRSNGCARARAD